MRDVVVMAGPYRQQHSVHPSSGEVESHALDRALWPVAIVLFGACVARAALVFSRGETFGPDASVAAVIVVLLPLLFARRLLVWVRARRSRQA